MILSIFLIELDARKFKELLVTFNKNRKERKYMRIVNRSSRLEVFCRKGFLRNFAKFTGKHFAKLLKTPFLTEHPQWLFLSQPGRLAGKMTSSRTWKYLGF